MKKIILIALIVMFTLTTIAATPINNDDDDKVKPKLSAIRLTVKNKSGEEIFIRLSYVEFPSQFFFYLPIDKGTKLNPEEKVFTITPRGLYNFELTIEGQIIENPLCLPLDRDYENAGIQVDLNKNLTMLFTQCSYAQTPPKFFVDNDGSIVLKDYDGLLRFAPLNYWIEYAD